MASLFGTKIKDTYESVLKLIDNLGLTATNKDITDGTGAVSGLKLGTGATVEVTKRVSQTGLGGSTFFGEDAGLTDDLLNSNSVAVGYKALRVNPGETGNVAIGSNALETNFYEHNTAVGYKALAFSTQGYSNSAVGSNSMLNQTTGYGNSALGVNSLKALTTASNNTALGYNSLSGSSYRDYNTAVGAEAGGGSYSGADGTFIGSRAGINASGDGQIIIGAYANGNGANTATIGGGGITHLHLMKPGAALSLRSPNSTVYDFSVDDAGVLGAAGVSPTTVNSITTGEPTGSDQVVNVVSLTQAEYDAGTPVATTFYIIL